MGTPLVELEASIRTIPGVQAARIKVDETGRPIEVHIVANGEKSPKQLVRDIQTMAMATFGIDLDYRTISVVQFPNGQSVSEREPRWTIDEVGTEIKGTQAKVQVVLRQEDETASGESAGARSKEGLARIAAGATVNALREAAEEWQLEVEHVSFQKAGPQEFVFVTLAAREKDVVVRLSGSAPHEGLPAESAVRAVLDAVNRRLGRY